MKFNSLAWKLLSSVMFLELLIYSHTVQDFLQHATQHFTLSSSKVSIWSPPYQTK